MKNLFKNLMLVAVAAMAFTACTESNNEVDASVEKVVLNFVAEIDNDGDETRSGFVGSTTDENGTKYQSAWDGTEKLAIFDMSTYNYLTETTINAEGQFSVEFEVDNMPDYIYVCSPASAWTDVNNYVIPTVQTPLENSVDPAAHILKNYVPTADGSVLSMQHQVAYGKMTLKGVDFEIARVELNLKGVKYGWDSKDITYTLHNNGSVVDNVFWFTTEPSFEISEFTVTAFDAEGNNAVTKTVDVAAAGKTLSFGYGQVSKFSVSDLQPIEIKPEAPKTLVFTSAKWSNSYTDKLVQFYTADGATLQLNWYNCGSDNWIVPNTYGFANSGAIYPGGQYSWYENEAFEIDTEIVDGTVIVSVVDGQYYIEFKNLADYSAVQIESATFTGAIEGLIVPDMREKLAAPSNITSTVDGKTITLSWDAVEGADSYRVKLYDPYDEHFETFVKAPGFEYEAANYSTDYSFTIMSCASDENLTYRSSDDAYVNVTTGKDPSIWADVVANNIIWDSSNGAFKMTGEVVSGTAWGYKNDYIRLFINESDRPGNNSIKVGTYTGCGGKNPQAGQFGAKFSLYWGTTTYESAFGSASTVEVSYDEAVGYTIVLTHDNKTYGYKGMPEGWVAPSEGGESGGGEPVNPDPEQGNELGSESNPYTFTSVASNGFFLNFEGAENGASLQLDRQNSDVNQMSNLGGPFALNYTAIIYAGSGNIYNDGEQVYQYASFAPYSTLEVTKADGNWTCKLKISVDGGATFTYYTYTGQIANQAY